MPVSAASVIGVALIRVGAELLEQRRKRVGRHVEDLRIAPHLLGDRLDGGLVVGQLSHRPILASGRKHVVGRLLGQREGARLGEGDGGLERGHDLALHRLQPGIVEFTLLPQLPLEQRDRILLLPRLDLRPVAGIGLAAAFGVAAPAVGLALDQRRAAARRAPAPRRAFAA